MRRAREVLTAFRRAARKDGAVNATLKKHGSRNRASRARKYSVQARHKSEVNQLELFSLKNEE